MTLASVKTESICYAGICSDRETLRYENGWDCRATTGVPQGADGRVVVVVEVAVHVAL